ncbi:hypothetical protein MP638_002405 [Amoeboaphelidium occidentale]|nr:hypothetical protein MP638_002405 [Amoeboaphelidium occidentale]
MLLPRLRYFKTINRFIISTRNTRLYSTCDRPVGVVQQRARGSQEMVAYNQQHLNQGSVVIQKHLPSAGSFIKKHSKSKYREGDEMFLRSYLRTISQQKHDNVPSSYCDVLKEETMLAGIQALLEQNKNVLLTPEEYAYILKACRSANYDFFLHHGYPDGFDIAFTLQNSELFEEYVRHQHRFHGVDALDDILQSLESQKAPNLNVFHSIIELYAHSGNFESAEMLLAEVSDALVSSDKFSEEEKALVYRDALESLVRGGCEHGTSNIKPHVDLLLSTKNTKTLDYAGEYLIKAHRADLNSIINLQKHETGKGPEEIKTTWKTLKAALSQTWDGTSIENVQHIHELLKFLEVYSIHDVSEESANLNRHFSELLAKNGFVPSVDILNTQMAINANSRYLREENCQLPDALLENKRLYMYYKSLGYYPEPKTCSALFRSCMKNLNTGLKAIPDNTKKDIFDIIDDMKTKVVPYTRDSLLCAVDALTSSGMFLEACREIQGAFKATSSVFSKCVVDDQILELFIHRASANGAVDQVETVLNIASQINSKKNKT